MSCKLPARPGRCLTWGCLRQGPCAAALGHVGGQTPHGDQQAVVHDALALAPRQSLRLAPINHCKHHKSYDIRLLNIYTI